MSLAAFLSYASADREAAGRVKVELEHGQVTTFMAHEDISVSETWRVRLLNELRSCDLFICLLSAHYLASPWCMQEAGIAAYRRKLIVVPLSLDGTAPPAFLESYQATAVDPQNVVISHIGAALFKREPEAGVNFVLGALSRSQGFREGEANMRAVLPLIPAMTDVHIASLLSVAASTYRVIQANLCVSEYLPPLVRRYGHLASPEALAKLKSACRIV